MSYSLLGKKTFITLGDCCTPFIVSSSEWGSPTCEECICHEDGLRHPENPCPPDYTQYEGECQDSWNIAECDYDGGEMNMISIGISILKQFLP